MGGTRRRRVARGLVVWACCATLLAAGPAAVTGAALHATAGQSAGDAAVAQPETADEYLKALRALNGSEAFAAYGEFEVIRVQAVADVQVGEFSATEAERMSLVLSVLRRFDDAYAMAENGSRDESLAAANETGALIDDLRETGSTEYVALASLALDRFYRDVGERFNAEAEATNRTPEKVALLEGAALAYRRAGAIERYTKLTVEADERRATYEDDMATVNETLSATDAFLSGCDGACASPLGAVGAFGSGVFGQYREARTLGFRVTEADALAEKHALADLESEVDSEYAEPIGAARSGLALASAIVAFLYALVVGTVAGLVTTRLVRWQEDVTASRVGEIVSAGGVR